MNRAALAAFAALALAGCGGDSEMAQAAGELSQAVRQAEQVGLPLTSDDVFGPAPSENDNAAPTLLQAGEGLDGGDGDNALLDLARRAAERPRYFRPQPLDSLDGLNFDDLNALRTLLSELLARARSRADSDPEEAILDLKAARQIAGHAATLPVSIGPLAAAKWMGESGSAAAELAGKWHGKPEMLAALAGMAAQTGPRLDLTQALRGEFYLGVTFFRNLPLMGGAAAVDKALQGEPMPEPSGEMKTEGLPSDPDGQAFLARHLQAWTALFTELKKASGLLDQGIALQEAQEAAAADPRPSARLMGSNFTVHRQTALELMRAQAGEEVLGAALAIHRWRAENGAFPESLEKANIVGLDLLAGEELRYRREGEGFAVWSVGFDKVSQRESDKAPASAEEADIVIAWPPAGAASQP
jgi:hypothetical protein